PTSWYGTLLKGVFNFQPDPTVLQVTVWALYLIPVLLFFFAPQRSLSMTRPAKPANASPGE
ncbi:iron transporter, partial [Streptomyces sp. NPDC102487]